MNYSVGCDIGGTFTDTVVLDESGIVHQFKSPTTPDAMHQGVMATLQLAASFFEMSLKSFLGSVSHFSHGTTVATNAILEHRGARTGLIQTKGFGDTLAIMRGGGRVDGRSEEEIRHFRTLTKPRPLLRQSDIVEVAERIDLDGKVLAPLTEAEARRAVRELLDVGVESIAVSLLWSFVNPVHERLLGRIVNELSPSTYLTLSSELIPRVREYERTSTTAINSYVGPVLQSKLATLGSELKVAGLECEPLLMLSHGGLANLPESIGRAASTLMSGPAGGVTCSARNGQQLGYPNIVTTDMGGTSFDVGLIVDGRPSILNQHLIGQYPVALPSIGINAIGIGGGSIASVRNGYLSVGPESAGSTPGPACFGRGGLEPTVTDANVVLAYLDPATYLGGKMRLDADAARAVIEERIAIPLGLSIEDAASAVRIVAENKMADLIRRATIERGHDPRDFVLFAFGGGGPTHAAGYGAEVGVRAIVVPDTAAAHSAYGIAESELKTTTERSELMATTQGVSNASEYLRPERINATLSELSRQAIETLRSQGADESVVAVRYLADMRFRGQIHELSIEIPGPALDAEQVDGLPAAFVVEYESRFGQGSAFAAAGIELVTLRVEASAARVASPNMIEPDPDETLLVPSEHRPVYLPELGGWTEVGLYDGSRLSPGDTLGGPGIVELSNTSVFVGEGQSARVDGAHNLVITKEQSK
ncbi:MAG TPA: hydantoinase/oxoprolinase family protein [Tepidiformaceae bacterium]